MLLLGSVLGMTLLAQAQNLVSVLRRDRDPLDPPLHPLRDQPAPRALARVGARSTSIVGSLGSATLLYGLAFLYGGSGSTDFAGIAAGIGPEGRARRPACPGRDRDGRRRPRLQDLDRPLPPVDAGRLRGRAHPDHRLHGGGDQGGRLRPLRPLLRRRPGAAGERLAAGAGGARRGLDRGRQRRRARPTLAEADARLLGRRPGRLHPRRPGRRQPVRRRRPRLLPRRLHGDEPRRLRGDRRPRARDRLRRRHPRRRGPRTRAPAPGLAADDLDARPGGDAGDRGLHRQALPDRGRWSRATTPGWPSSSRSGR